VRTSAAMSERAKGIKSKCQCCKREMLKFGYVKTDHSWARGVTVSSSWVEEVVEGGGYVGRICM